MDENDHEHVEPVMDMAEHVEQGQDGTALKAAFDRFAHELIEVVNTTPADQRHAAVVAKLNSFRGV